MELPTIMLLDATLKIQHMLVLHYELCFAPFSVNLHTIVCKTDSSKCSHEVFTYLHEVHFWLYAPLAQQASTAMCDAPLNLCGKNVSEQSGVN